MAVNKKPKSDANDTRLSVLEYKVDELKISVDRMETKQDGLGVKLDGLRYVSHHEFEEYKKEVEKKYATETSLKFIKTIGYTLASGLILAFIGFLVWLLQKALE